MEGVVYTFVWVILYNTLLCKLINFYIFLEPVRKNFFNDDNGLIFEIHFTPVFVLFPAPNIHDISLYIMAKKDKKTKDAKKARMALKNEKNSKKAEKTMKKQSKKAGDDIEDDVDIDELLKQLAEEQEKYEKIHITTVERPTKRTSSTLVSAPSAHKKELFLFGGEFTTSSGTVNFYNDLHVYSPDSDTWRRYLSKNAPLARSIFLVKRPKKRKPMVIVIKLKKLNITRVLILVKWLQRIFS